MKIVKSGSKLQIHGDDLIILETIPAATYKVGFSMTEGFYLREVSDLKLAEEKIYGTNLDKVMKTLRAFQTSSRSIGAMFTGKKGYGKSLSLQLLSHKALELGIPSIIVTINVPGLSDFLQSIEQEVVIIFDEYEKNFSVDGGGETQEKMLSLFDGLAVSKHLYVISANEMSRVSEYLIDRPGRFHYHFQFEEPTPQEVFEYMSDKLKPEYQASAKSVMELAKRTKFNFDTLRALAFELNLGYSLGEAIRDLNVSLNESVHYHFEAFFSDGSHASSTMDIRLSTTEKSVGFESAQDSNIILRADLEIAKLKYEDDEFKIDPSKIHVSFAHTRNDDDDKDNYVVPIEIPTVVSATLKRKPVFGARDNLSDLVDTF